MIHLLLTIFVVFFYSCDQDDPILNKASTMKTVSVEKEKESQNKSISKKVNTSNENIEREIEKNEINIEKNEPVRNESSEKMIVLSGEIVVENWSGKGIRIDVFDGDQQALKGPRPSVIKVEYQNEPGSFSVSVPSSQNPLWIGAYIDEDQDGKPGEKDPFGWYDKNPVSSDKDTDGIKLVLKTPKHLEK